VDRGEQAREHLGRWRHGRTLGVTKPAASVPAADVTDGMTADEVLAVLGPSDDEDGAPRNHEAAERAPRGNGRGERQPVLVNMAKVASEPVNWYWPGRLARRKPTALVGDPGLGKSFLALDAIARLTMCRPWPDGAPGVLEPVPCLLLSAEDDLADTVRPRLDAMGANPELVTALAATKQASGTESQFDLGADLDVLETALEWTGAGLVVVDPVGAYISASTDTHRDAAVRATLAPFVALCSRYDAALLYVAHLNKSQQQQVLYRVGGSVAFVAAARVALVLAKDKDDPSGERRLVMPLKSNLTKPPPSLAFRIGTQGTEWESGPITADAETVLAADDEDRAERGAAASLLTDLLADGVEVPVREIRDAAAAQGVGWRSVERAKSRLNVVARRVGAQGSRGAGQWIWTLAPPADDAGASRPPYTETAAALIETHAEPGLPSSPPCSGGVTALT
jgi:putative DNA primase/helicase